VRWLRTNADRIGLDPNRLAVAGGSAGGHLAAASDDLSISAIPDLLRTFASDVARAQGEIELHFFENEGHGFFNYRDADSAAGFANWRYNFAKTMEITRGFLDRHLRTSG